MSNTTGGLECSDIRNISLYCCTSLVMATYLAAGLYALWKLRHNRKVGFLPLIFLVAGFITAALLCSVTCVIEARILCIMKVQEVTSKPFYFVLLGFVEAAVLLGVVVSQSFLSV